MRSRPWEGRRAPLLLPRNDMFRARSLYSGSLEDFPGRGEGAGVGGSGGSLFLEPHPQDDKRARGEGESASPLPCTPGVPEGPGGAGRGEHARWEGSGRLSFLLPAGILGLAYLSCALPLRLRRFRAVNSLGSPMGGEACCFQLLTGEGGDRLIHLSTQEWELHFDVRSKPWFPGATEGSSLSVFILLPRPFRKGEGDGGFPWNPLYTRRLLFLTTTLIDCIRPISQMRRLRLGQ